MDVVYFKIPTISKVSKFSVIGHTGNILDFIDKNIKIDAILGISITREKILPNMFIDKIQNIIIIEHIFKKYWSTNVKNRITLVGSNISFNWGSKLVFSVIKLTANVYL